MAQDPKPKKKKLTQKELELSMERHFGTTPTMPPKKKVKPKKIYDPDEVPYMMHRLMKEHEHMKAPSLGSERADSLAREATNDEVIARQIRRAKRLKGNDPNVDRYGPMFDEPVVRDRPKRFKVGEAEDNEDNHFTIVAESVKRGVSAKAKKGK